MSQEKTKIYFSRNVNHNRATEISEAFGFSLTGDLGKYLGVPLIHKRVSANGFSYVTNRLLNKLSDWKVNSISLAGTITLCSSILSTIPSLFNADHASS